MLPKIGKTSKKGELIALGTRSKQESQNDSNNSSTSASLKTNKLSSSSLASSSSSNELANLATAASSTISSKLSRSNVSNSSSNLSSLSNTNPATATLPSLDPKTIKDEINIALESQDSEEKLIKLIKAIIISLKGGAQTQHAPIAASSGLVKRPQPSQMQQQQPDLNFVMALSYVSLERPNMFIKNESLTEFLCTNLLFTSKMGLQDKSSSVPNVLKSKTLHLLRPQSPQQSSIQPTICNILHFIYGNEPIWPEIFLKAFIDDSLGERSWVDSSLCKEFVENIKAAFSTRQIPFSAETTNSLPVNVHTGSTNDQLKSEEQQSFMTNPVTIMDSNSDSNDVVIQRYASIKTQVEEFIIDTIRNQIKLAASQQPLTQRLTTTATSASNLSMGGIENKNFLKLLQHSCGFEEVRQMVVSKLELWLNNPKLTTQAQDLLMSVCVNCNKGDYSEKNLIAQIVKLKPKLKQQQHYYDCIKELIKLNTANFETLVQLVIVNELLQQQQQQQSIQQQQPQQLIAQSSRNQHNLNLLQTAFSVDGSLASKLLAQTMQKIILQKQGDEFLRLLRILLRDTIRNSRQDFDLIKFSRELISDSLLKQFFFSQNAPSNPSDHLNSYIFSLAGGLADFNQTVQIRERYVSNICDLLTIIYLVAITPQIKEAYLRRQPETKEVLIKYYMQMTQIQCDTVTWLQEIFRLYQINPMELITFLFKILFMIDKPEQCYTIDNNWPSEQERGTMFRVVSETPVLSETLHQVLMITLELPDKMYLHMLFVVENLLKLAALVHNKDIYSIKLTKIDQFVQSLFNICLYKCHQVTSSTNLVVTLLYWKAWQILLIVSALDPKGFGHTAWEQYPTLRILMEMIMTDDYNYPPQSSLTDEMTIERFRLIEQQVNLVEKQEILEFENLFALKQQPPGSNQPIIRLTEANSMLITKVMKFEPSGSPRRPPNDLLQNIRKLNSEYKLGQLLCKSRQPDFLLNLIKRQNSSKNSFSWLASLIESSINDCLDIMPIQCVCEFLWNALVGTEEITLKKQLNLEKLMFKIKQILTTTELSDSIVITQIKDTFDYFLNKLCSDKLFVRNASLKILRRLLITNCPLDKTFLQQPQPQTSIQIDLNQLLNTFKELSAFDIYLKPLLIKYFRKTLMVETKADYINLYLNFLFEQLLNDYKKQIDFESSLKMEIESVDIIAAASSSLDESFKTNYNEISMDLAEFFFQRNYYLTSTISLTKYCDLDSFNKISLHEKEDKLNEIKIMLKFLSKFSLLILKLNEHSLNNNENDSSSNNLKILLKNKQPFDRNQLDKNSYLLLEIDQKSSTNYLYIHEKIFNLIIYFFLIIVQTSNCLKKLSKSDDQEMTEYNGASKSNDDENSLLNYEEDFIKFSEYLFSFELTNNFKFKLLNCKFQKALNNLIVDKILRLSLNFKLNSFCAENILKQLNSYNFYCIEYKNKPLEQTLRKNNKEKILAFKILDLLIESMSDDVSELMEFVLKKFGMTPVSVFLLMRKIEYELKLKSDAKTAQPLINASNNMISDLNVTYVQEIIVSYFEKFRNALLMPNNLKDLVFFDLNEGKCLLIDALKKANELSIKSVNENDVEMVPVNTNSTSNGDAKLVDAEPQLKLFSFNQSNKEKLKEYDHDQMIPDNDSTDHQSNNLYLNEIKSKIKDLKARKQMKIVDTRNQDKSNANEELVETSSIKQLIHIIDESNNRNLETNLNKKLNEMGSENERIISLAESILVYENEKSHIKTPRKTSKEKLKRLTSSERCIVDILLDYFCHFDPQIINKQFNIELRLLFESRSTFLATSLEFENDDQQITASAITQSFLLSLFIHQASWDKLFNCTQYLLENHKFFSSNFNVTIILDFLSSLIHIPELWKGTESRVLEKFTEETVLSLNENQICCLVDLIIEEMCIIYEQNKKQAIIKHTKITNLNGFVKDYEDYDLIELKYKIKKRVQLLKHFVQKFNSNTKQKEALFEQILSHLNVQKQDMNYNKMCFNNATKIFSNMSTDYKNNVLNKIQTLFLYCVYLEENSIINCINNPARLFSNIYYQLDNPTTLDLKVHNLLNCFGEIEVNYSNNLTSSGIIGVSSVVTHFKKQEKQELVQYNKKQELFMTDANLVCIKLASTHPFIFIRQLPMMEGLLQGRVVYSFEEFKRRKFDKLFHYIIDLLHVLVPFVFHRAYITHIEAIITHYFEMFMSYCTENREAIASLVVKFCDFLEKFINADINVGHALIIKKFAKFITHLQKSYPELSSLKYLNSLEAIPFENLELDKTSETSLLKQIPSSSLRSVNILNQKSTPSVLTPKQLDPFISKISNRENYNGVLSVLQELDAVSQRQPFILSHFVQYLQPLMLDSSEQLRDMSFNLIMRYLRLNPKDVSSFIQIYSECLISSNSRVFHSAIKIFPDFNLLCQKKSQDVLIKCALKGSSNHNVDISKQLTDAIKLLNLEKYVH